MNIEKHFCSYEQSKELRDLGFFDTVLKLVQAPSGDLIKRPLKSQAFEFFREEYGWFSEIEFSGRYQSGIVEEFEIYIVDRKKCITQWIVKSEYEEAENAAIDKLIELAKEIKKD